MRSIPFRSLSAVLVFAISCGIPLTRSTHAQDSINTGPTQAARDENGNLIPPTGEQAQTERVIVTFPNIPRPKK